MLDLSFTYIEMYFRYLRLTLEAREWLRGNGPVKTAAFCMFHLNRYARCHSGSIVYPLKTQFVRWLYETGYCTAVSLQKQTMACWTCGGTGEYDHWNMCHRCDGTGIYRQHHLYRFVFNVDGRTYIWHQPKSLVDWPVKITELGLGEYSATPRYGDAPERELTELYLVTLMEFLRLAGTDPDLRGHYKVFGNFWRAVGEDLRTNGRDLRWRWRHWRHNLKWSQPGRWWQNLRRLWAYAETGEMSKGRVDDEIPF